nr:hypothetical protein [Tanacetum cinerariifolium]
DPVQDEVAFKIPPKGNASVTGVALETGLEKEFTSMGPLVNKRRRKRGNNKEEANAPPKVLRTDYDASRPAQSTHGGKFLALMGLDVGSLLSTLAAQGPSTATKSVSDPEPLSYANPLLYPEKDIATKCVSDPEPLSHEWRQLVGTKVGDCSNNDSVERPASPDSHASAVAR